MYIKDHPWDRCSLIESLSNCLPLIIFFFAVLSVASFHLLFLLFLFSSRFHPCIDTHVNPNYFGTLSSVVKQLQRLGVILVLQLSLCRTMDSGASTDLKHYFSPPFLQLWSNSRNFGVILVLQFSLCRTMDSGVSTDLKPYFSPHFLQLWSNSRNFGVILVLQFSLCRTMDSGVSTDLKLRSRKSNSSMNIFWVWQHCRLTQNEFLRIYIYAAANC
jgi:hypothetical protein